MDVHGVGSRYFLVTIADCSLAYLNSASFPHGRGTAPGRAVFLLAWNIIIVAGEILRLI